MVHPAAERSAEASESSKACSHFLRWTPWDDAEELPIEKWGVNFGALTMGNGDLALKNGDLTWFNMI